jgi:type II secretory pathway pseudopilin PulG
MVVIMAVMAILLTITAETVSFQQRREKEEELIFRGNQAVEAIRLFRARNGRFPVELTELVNARPRVLRKVWADPVTSKVDWVPVFLGEDGTTLAGGLPVAGAAPAATPPAGQSGSTPPTRSQSAHGPIIGVRSPSCADAIKIYNGHTRYCDWKFFFDTQRQGTPALAVQPAATPGH